MNDDVVIHFLTRRLLDEPTVKAVAAELAAAVECAGNGISC